MNQKLPPAHSDSDQDHLVFGPKMKVKETGRIGLLKDHTTGPSRADLGYILEFPDGHASTFRRDQVDYAV